MHVVVQHVRESVHLWRRLHILGLLLAGLLLQLGVVLGKGKLHLISLLLQLRLLLGYISLHLGLSLILIDVI